MGPPRTHVGRKVLYRRACRNGLPRKSIRRGVDEHARCHWSGTSGGQCCRRDGGHGPRSNVLYRRRPTVQRLQRPAPQSASVATIRGSQREFFLACCRGRPMANLAISIYMFQGLARRQEILDRLAHNELGSIPPRNLQGTDVAHPARYLHVHVPTGDDEATKKMAQKSAPPSRRTRRSRSRVFFSMQMVDKLDKWLRHTAGGRGRRPPVCLCGAAAGANRAGHVRRRTSVLLGKLAFAHTGRMAAIRQRPGVMWRSNDGLRCDGVTGRLRARPPRSFDVQSQEQSAEVATARHARPGL